jgi:hypothetical protein
MERPRDPFDFVIGLREEMTELRVTVGHIATDVSELRQQSRTDIRRLDERIFQLLLLQLGTLTTALVAIVAAVVT